MAHTRPTAHQGPNAPSSRVQRQRAVAERLAPGPGITVQRFRGKNRPSTPLFHARTARPAHAAAPPRPARGAVWSRETSRSARRNRPFRASTRQLQPSRSAATASRHAPPRPATATTQLFRQGAAGLFTANKLYISAAARHLAAACAPQPPSDRQRLIKHKNLLRFILKQN